MVQGKHKKTVPLLAGRLKYVRVKLKGAVDGFHSSDFPNGSGWFFGNRMRWISVVFPGSCDLVVLRILALGGLS